MFIFARRGTQFTVKNILWSEHDKEMHFSLYTLAESIFFLYIYTQSVGCEFFMHLVTKPHIIGF